MPTLVSCQLDAAGLDTLDLSSGALVATYLDLGFPVVREVTQDAPDADGSIDTTEKIGPRAVTLNVQVNELLGSESRWALTQRFKAFLSPRLRPVLTFQQSTDAPVQRVTLRAANLSDPFAPVQNNRNVVDITTQWVAPSGVIESAILNEQIIRPGTGATDGLEFGTELEFGTTLEFPDSDPPGTGYVTNAGTYHALPLVQMFGPFGDNTPSSGDETVLTNVTTGRELVFSELEAAAGEYVEVDFKAKTVVLVSADGSTVTDVYDKLVLPPQWWDLGPEVTEVAWQPDTFSGNAQALIRWRDTSL